LLVPVPSYPLFDFLAGLEGLTTREYRVWLDGERWRIDFASLHAAAGPGARAVIVVHPHNPTGATVDRTELATLRRICADHGLALISDEVFADTIEPDRDTPASLLEGAESGPLTFALAGVSKLLALPQLKLAWIVAGGPPRLRDEALARLEVIADTFLSVSEPVQLLLPALLAGRDAVRNEMRERLTGNRAALEAALMPPHQRLLPSRGGWSAVLRVTRDARGAPPDEDALVAALLERGLLVHPGWFFDLAPEAAGEPAAHLVLSLLAEPAAFARAARELAQSLA
jgi:aspartate/methionine/tyrosine aminotransferase